MECLGGSVNTGVFSVGLGVSNANSTGLAAWGKVTEDEGWNTPWLFSSRAKPVSMAVSRRCPGLCSHLQWGTSCETCRWDGAASISGHVWWLEVQYRPSLDMANTTRGSVWVLSTAWMHKESLYFLEFIQSAVMEFVSLLYHLWKSPNSSFPPVLNVAKREGKLRIEELPRGQCCCPPCSLAPFLARFHGEVEGGRDQLFTKYLP